MNERRKPGEGTIRELPSGRFQVGFTLATGKRAWLDPVDTEDDAEALRNAALAELAAGNVAPVGGATFSTYAAKVLDRRELAGFDSDTYRYAVKRIEPFAHWFARPLRSVTPRDVRETFDAIDRRFGRNTARSSLTAVRIVFSEAVRDDIVEESPARAYEWPKRKGKKQREIAYFTEDQIAGLRAYMSPEQARFFDFAVATGLRISEQIALRAADVRVDGPSPHVRVRFGGPPKKPTKSGEERRVPLFGVALEAARAQLASLRKSTNPLGLMWPTVTGKYRDRNRPLGQRRDATTRKVVCLWAEIRARVGASEAHVWHSLRHTTATWLLSGHFGHRWSIEQVQALLGHADIKTTQVYAELTDTALDDVGEITRRSRPEAAPARLPEKTSADRAEAAALSADRLDRRGPEWFRDLAPLCDRFVIATRDESPEAAALGRDLAQAVLASAPVRLALAVISDSAHVISRGLDLVDALDGAAAARVVEARARRIGS